MKCSKNLGSYVFIYRVFPRQFLSDRQHGQAIERHPRGPVRLLQDTAFDGLRAVEHADVVEPEESARENVASCDVLAIRPPGEINQQLFEIPAREMRDLADPVTPKSCIRATPPTHEPAD